MQQIIDARQLSHVYCACFSADPDSRSQWLEYADDGHGVAIGFETSQFELERMAPSRNVELAAVIYDRDEHERAAEDLIRLLQHKDGTAASAISAQLASQSIWWEAPKFKKCVFCAENEWRLIVRDNPKDAIRFRERGGRNLIPYIEFVINPKRNPIRQIWLGPRNLSQRNVDAISQLLHNSGFEADYVRFPKSQIPLRPEY